MSQGFYVIIAILFFGVAVMFNRLPSAEPVESVIPENSNDYIIPHFQKSDHTPIRILNNPNAQIYTWEETRRMLLDDETEQKNYVPVTYTCAHFAQDLHNRCEAKGLRTGIVLFEYKDGSEGHAINAFNTTDKGVVYVDATGIAQSDVEVPAVKSVAYLFEGKHYFAIPMEVDITREYPSNYSAGLHYLNERKRHGERASKFETKASRFQSRVERFKQQQEQFKALQEKLNRSKENWAQRGYPENERREINREIEKLNRIAESFNRESKELEEIQSKLGQDADNLNKRSRELLWVNTTKHSPVAKIHVYW